jgi:hypothetical protein
MFLLGVIDISLSNTPVYFLPFLSSIIIPIVLVPHFLIVDQKFDTTLIFQSFRNVSLDVVLLLNDVACILGGLVWVIGLIGVGFVVATIVG